MRFRGPGPYDEPMGNQPRKGLMRSLGEFVGHIAHAVRTPAPRADQREVRREVETEERQTPEGRVKLRRTIIEEIELPPKD